MTTKKGMATKVLGTLIGVLLYACVLAIGSWAAVGLVTWMAYATETTFLDTAAVLAVALYGMSVADRMLSRLIRWVLKRALLWCLDRLRTIMGKPAQMTEAEAAEAIDRVPVWLDRPPCEGTYLVKHPGGEVEHGVQVKRYLPRMGLWAILMQGLTDVDNLVAEGYRFDGPLSDT